MPTHRLPRRRRRRRRRRLHRRLHRRRRRRRRRSHKVPRRAGGVEGDPGGWVGVGRKGGAGAAYVCRDKSLEERTKWRAYKIEPCFFKKKMRFLETTSVTHTPVELALLGVVSSCLPACLVSVVRPPFDLYIIYFNFVCLL